MIQPLYTDKQRQELRQHQILMHGGRTQKNQLSQETIKQIKKDYYDMFIGFTSVNWSKPGTKLGTAWQKALSQMATYIKTKSNVPNNPVYKCLVDIHKKFSKRISEHIMKCRGRESETVLPERYGGLEKSCLFVTTFKKLNEEKMFEFFEVPAKSMGLDEREEIILFLPGTVFVFFF